ncbi:DNA polymerase alpha catalytic subunit isoform X2 [Macrosteles quadrilineatus]|uniref:DNA polymerase alpha catalytic subunit isoform X2 n=1 Tax=Macrosteles quadrilineatus TaxID=74068 RepID=UPI0023E26D5D|nr:DNA polymerase alpha catalytic subunit isoform X2 [Macrosteles quadrilineatus]
MMCAVKLEDDDILGDLIQELDSKKDSTPGPRPSPLSVKQEVSTKDYLKSFSTVAPKPKPVRVSSGPKVKHHLGYVKEGLPQNGHEDTPLIDDNFTEDHEPIVMDVEPLLEIKKEPEDIPLIEDLDSNDGFSDVALQQMDKQIEEFETQEFDQNVVVKQEVEEDFKIQAKDISVKLSNGALWDEMESSVKCPESATAVNVDPSQLPLTTNDNGEKVFRFFYWDAYEDIYKQPGTVYLFGKVLIPTANVHVSCCVIMKDIERTIQLLPREQFIDLKTGKPTGKLVTIEDVYNEWNDKISVKYKIDPFKYLPVEKHYAFELDDIPTTSQYLEVKYSPTMAQLPKDLTGETIAHVFGTNSSFLELLLLKRKIKGPCWLDLAEPTLATNPVSFCKVEVVCHESSQLNVCVSPAPPPPLTLASVNLRTDLNPHSHQPEIIMASVTTHHNYCIDKQVKMPFQEHFFALSRPSGTVFPIDLKDKLKKDPRLKVELCNNERALLCYLLAKLGTLDPDLVVGHGLLSGDLDVLIHRLAHLKIPNWSRIGRLRRANIPPPGKARFQVERYPMCGRLVCDVKVSAKELIRARSYDLGTLCQSVLKIKEERLDLAPDEVKGHYSSSKTLLEVIWATMMDSVYILKLMYEMNVIPLALQITNIAGNVMSRTLMGGRAERNEFLLLHAFTEKDYIIPDKQYGKKNPKGDAHDEETVVDAEQPKKGGRKKPSYAGGLVLDPKVGFYDKLILLMDFNSLYPSIIHEYNICFTTVIKVVTESEEGTMITAEPPDADEELGILPTEIRKLVESRRDVKKMMKAPGLSPDLKMQYDIRQMALKLTANSMYGCLGFSNSRFYAKPIAALITAKGREILTNTRDLVQKLSYDVIYGDTDSIMINTNILEYDQVFKIGNKIKAEVNKMYKHVELDIDGVFKFMLLLKKKKYAAVSVTRLPSGELVCTEEMKGLDMVRRDWSQLAAEAGKFVLSQILSDQEPDERIQNIHRQLTKLKDDLETGKVPLELMTITKQLTKSPDQYSDKKGQPHVQVALRLNGRGARLKAGDTVNYVICEDGTNNPATQRAYHVDELKNSESLKLDIRYYLSQQIQPVISRLIEPIEGTDSAQVAECLGLDPAQFKDKIKTYEEVKTGESIILQDQERFKNCEKFIFKCVNPECLCENVIEGPVRKTESGDVLVLERCVNPDCSAQPTQYLSHIKNTLTLTMRAFITKYYQGWLICEDPACSQRTRRIPLRFENYYPVCSLCGKNNMYREYTEKQLYTQLSYLQHVFDISKPPHNTLRVSVETFNMYATLKEHVSRTLSISGYSVINLSKLFSGLFPNPIQIKQEPVQD